MCDIALVYSQWQFIYCFEMEETPLGRKRHDR